MARMSLDDIRGDAAVSEASDVIRVEGVTEEDIARWNAEDGFDPADTMAGLRRVYSPAEIRERTGLTQSEIAARLRVPVKTWRNWEQGRTSLDPAVRALLDIVADDPARAFGALGTGPRLVPAIELGEVVAMFASTARAVEDIRREVAGTMRTAIGKRAVSRGRMRVRVVAGPRLETVVVDRRVADRHVAEVAPDGEVRADMEVVGSDGVLVGTVDSVDGGRLAVRAAGAAAGGQHHYLPWSIVDSVLDRVTLAVTADEAEVRSATA